jgi:hypothetical protein
MPCIERKNRWENIRWEERARKGKRGMKRTEEKENHLERVRWRTWTN